MKIYLAGPITGLTWDEATIWRKQVSSELAQFGIECFSPLRFKNFLSHLDKQLPIQNSYPDFGLSTPRGITTRDRWDATRCDVMFVNFLGAKKVSIGTVMEIAWADLKRIPVIVIMEPDNIHHHAMIHESIGFVVETIDEAVETVKALLMEDQ